jgi:putative hydrolase of the HAD superfamily
MVSPRPYDALVLDFGAVLNKTAFEVLDKVEVALGLPPGTLPWRGPLDPATDQVWQDMQAGRITERDYWALRSAEVGRHVGESWDMKAFMLRCADILGGSWFREEFVDLLDDARAAGIRRAVLSNELELFHGAEWLDTVPALKRIEVLVDATHTKILKPDRRAYAMVLDAIDVAPARALFVDDQMRNIDGALAAGMAAIHFDIRRPGEIISEIRRALGLSQNGSNGHVR